MKTKVLKKHYYGTQKTMSKKRVGRFGKNWNNFLLP